MNIQLSISCSLLNQSAFIGKFMEGLIECGKTVFFRDNNCDCGSHEVVYSKFKMICGEVDNHKAAYRVKIWAVEDVVASAILGGQQFSVVYHLKEEPSNKLRIGEARNVIEVNEFNEIREILNLSLFDLQKRSKVQYLMRKCHKRYEGDLARQVIYEMGQKAAKMHLNNGIKRLVHLSRCHHQRRLKQLKKYFNLWMIQRCESNLSDINNQIVKEGYFHTVSRNELVQGCFFAWKTLWLRTRLS